MFLIHTAHVDVLWARESQGEVSVECLILCALCWWTSVSAGHTEQHVLYWVTSSPSQHVAARQNDEQHWKAVYVIRKSAHAPAVCSHPALRAHTHVRAHTRGSLLTPNHTKEIIWWTRESCCIRSGLKIKKLAVGFVEAEGERDSALSWWDEPHAMTRSVLCNLGKAESSFFLGYYIKVYLLGLYNLIVYNG